MRPRAHTYALIWQRPHGEGPTWRDCQPKGRPHLATLAQRGSSAPGGSRTARASAFGGTAHQVRPPTAPARQGPAPTVSPAALPGRALAARTVPNEGLSMRLQQVWASSKKLHRPSTRQFIEHDSLCESSMRSRAHTYALVWRRPRSAGLVWRQLRGEGRPHLAATAQQGPSSLGGAVADRARSPSTARRARRPPYPDGLRRASSILPRRPAASTATKRRVYTRPRTGSTHGAKKGPAWRRPCSRR